MASRNERFVGVYEVSARPSGVPNVTAPISQTALACIMTAVHAARKKGEPIGKELAEDRLYVAFDDMKFYQREGLVAMLFTVTDVTAADFVYRSVRSGGLRQFKKRPDEGGAVTTHLVMKLQPNPDTLRYRAGLEDTEGATRSRILPFLEEQFRTYCGPVTATTDQGPRQGDAKLEMDSIQRDTIQDAAGRPVAVELVRLRPRHALDPGSVEGYSESKRTILFQIDGQQPDEEAVDSVVKIRRLQQTEYPNYPTLRIRWKREDNRFQTLTVEALADDLLQRAFTRMERITGIRPDLPSAYVDIRDDVVRKIAAKL